LPFQDAKNVGPQVLGAAAMVRLSARDVGAKQFTQKAISLA
jgi:hypothetical protein